LTDLVAYLKSLTGPGGDRVPGPVQAGAKTLPEAPATAGVGFFVQMYDIRPGMLARFEDWFAREGKAQFMAQPGLLGIDTSADRPRDGPSMVTVLRFESQGAMNRFLSDPGTDALGKAFDAFIGPHGHDTYRIAPIYRVSSLSAP